MRKSLYYRLCELRNIISTVRFNFHYFGIKGVIIRPIVFYTKARLRDMKGEIILNTPMRHSIVSLGIPGNEMFPYSTPIIWSDQGGKITIDDSFGTNGGASFVIRNGASLHIEGKSSFGYNLRLLCSESITISREVLGSWDVTIMDTDSHYFEDINSHQLSKFSKPIYINSHCFIGSHATILKGSSLPVGAVIAAHAVVAGKLYESESLYAGIPAKLVKKNIRYNH